MAPHDIRRPHKRPAISDQQKRRELSLQRQQQNRRDAQQQARSLASTLLSLSSTFNEPSTSESVLEVELNELDSQTECSPVLRSQSEFNEPSLKEFDVRQASKLKGSEARKWFSRQLLLPEWMIDVPDRLSEDWYVFARPSGKRCFVVSSNGTTISRLRNGSILHRFPSALPNGARRRDASGSGQSYSILDCIFHEMDQTYYVIDMICWRGYSLYDCTAEFRFFWLNSKLVESGASEPPSYYHKYKFSLVPVYTCDQNGFYAAYTGAAPYIKDGLLFYNKHSHYQPGNTPLALVWKDESCSRYVIDTDSNRQVPSQQQVVLELQDDGKVTTSDDPPVDFGCLDGNFIEKSGLSSGNLLRFAIGDGGLTIVDGRIQGADLQYVGKVNGARAFADSYSKVMFQYAARHSPLKVDDLLTSINSSNDHREDGDTEMDG
ncbi:snurportin-1 [Cucurbita pepo subsp. pepo]|uniref:snurportin-1 n=1 Tax=Cucurbita pepo subsp. pepo TaxID=3664 RepID=UPI000C9D5703|nr:snurportin-1 [Cucurbita pepo subsp. pepo]